MGPVTARGQASRLAGSVDAAHLRRRREQCCHAQDYGRDDRGERDRRLHRHPTTVVTERQCALRFLRLCSGYP